MSQPYEASYTKPKSMASKYISAPRPSKKALGALGYFDQGVAWGFKTRPDTFQA